MLKKKPTRLKLEGYNEDHVPEPLLEALTKLRKSGHDALLVGGCIRDYLLGFTPKDFDSVTDAKPEQLIKILPRTRIIGRRFRLVQLRARREIYEIATYRREAHSSLLKRYLKSHGAMADNAYGNQNQDAFRRDFTINAIYYDPHKREVIDHVGGLKDIEDRVLRCLGPADVRFHEDPVRILRAARLSAKLDLKIDDEVLEAIQVHKSQLRNVNRPRLRDELLKLFLTGHGESSYQALQRMDLLGFVFPQHPECEGMIIQSMREADERIASGFNATPAYLFGTMLWHIYADELRALQAGSRRRGKASLKRDRACKNTIQKARDYVAISRNYMDFIAGMYSLQPFLEHKNATDKVLGHPQLRAAVHLLNLRAAAGEVSQNLVKWWESRQPPRRTRRKNRAPQQAKNPTSKKGSRRRRRNSPQTDKSRRR